MINISKKNLSFLLFFFILFFYTNNQNARETLIYADNISYDKNQNIVAKGKAKVLHKGKIITSDLIIYSKKTGDIILPVEFSFKDEKNNHYFGSSGVFTNNLENATIDNVKVQLDDGSRIVGKEAKRIKEIDIITKGVYTPCNSKIKIGNFVY